MRNSIYSFFAIAALIFTVSACTKDGQLNAPNGQIAATYTKLKINQPDLMALVGADSTKTVNWTVSPAGSDSLAVQKNAARLVFTKAGTYTVGASQAGAASANITITVIDSLYAPTPFATPFTAGEQITVKPQYVKSTHSDSTYLAFTVTTKNAYCANSKIDMGVFYDTNAGNYYMQLTQIVHPLDCGVGSSTLTGHLDYSSYQVSLIDGNYPLYIEFNNQPNVVGSIEITDTQIIFHWVNTAGIVISPSTLSR
jgi:predicted small lipoprotein YifL